MGQFMHAFPFQPHWPIVRSNFHFDWTEFQGLHSGLVTKLIDCIINVQSPFFIEEFTPIQYMLVVKLAFQIEVIFCIRV